MRIAKLRWNIADQLNRFPGTCWADLVSWVSPGRRRRSERQRFIRTRRDGQTAGLLRMVGTGDCRADAARTGTCYCGKFRTAEAQVQCDLRPGPSRFMVVANGKGES